MLQYHYGETRKGDLCGGCFWGVEASFRVVPGVIEVVSGYTGGHSEHPTYEQVCEGHTGHAEAVEIVFDPARTTYETVSTEIFCTT